MKCRPVPVGSGLAKSFINIYAHFPNTHYESVPFHGNFFSESFTCSLSLSFSFDTSNFHSFWAILRMERLILRVWYLNLCQMSENE